jgi:hypothetical protein
MVNVPAGYVGLLNQMSTATGIPYAVEAAQANDESGFSPTAVSSAGAEGWLQFLPSTYNSYASAAGVQPGTEFNPQDEADVYDAFMSSLLKEEGGNLRDALAAYNAGPGNLAAGYGYADSILSAAGVSSNTTVSGGTGTSGTTTDSALGSLVGGLSVSGVVTDAIDAVLKMFGLGNIQDMFERLGLIILGFVLVIVGIHLLASGSGSPVTVNTTTDETAGTSTRTVKTPVSKSTRKVGTGVGAGSAIEAAGAA